MATSAHRYEGRYKDKRQERARRGMSALTVISATAFVVFTRLTASIVWESPFSMSGCRSANVGIVMYVGLQHDCTVVILSSIVGPLAQRLTCVATAMLGGATTSDVG